MRTTIRRALVASLPMFAGYMVLGTGYGILLNSHGYGVLWAFCTSLFIYAGSLQYVAVDLMVSGASLVTTAVTAFMVNARHLFYSISMVDTYRGAGRKKPYLAFALTDEVYSVLCNIDDVELPPSVDKKAFCFWVSVFSQCWWVGGSTLGGIVGATLDFDFAGIDFAMTALFMAAFIEQWLSAKNRLPAIIGVSVSVICLLVWGPDSFLIPTMIFITVLLTAARRIGWIGESVMASPAENGGDCNE